MFRSLLCKYPDADSARNAVTGLLREISSNPLQGSSLPMTISELCGHFAQGELTDDNTWRSVSTKKAYKAYLKRWITTFRRTPVLVNKPDIGIIDGPVQIIVEASGS